MIGLQQGKPVAGFRGFVSKKPEIGSTAQRCLFHKANGLTAVGGFHQCNFIGPGFNEIGEVIEALFAQGTGHGRPFRERVRRRHAGTVHIRFSTSDNSPHRGVGGRIQILKCLGGRGIGPDTANVVTCRFGAKTIEVASRAALVVLKCVWVQSSGSCY